MAEGFAQRASPSAILRSILASYPYSISLFQEILQNSEDAGARKQTFVLDRRSYSTEGLYHNNLAAAQGPALLAFNDAYFKEDDWHALQHSFESSKISDSSKIGKFGVGFRSVFHLTDCPQIMSGDLFALFDPLKSFTGSEGKKLDIAQLLADCPGQLSSFKYFMDQGILQGARFNGTVVRCPLRVGRGSAISSEVVKPEQLCALLSEFAQTSLDLSLLFLKNLENVTIVDVDETGTTRILASLDFTRSNVQQISEHCQFQNATSIVSFSGPSVTKSWNIITCPFTGEQANRILSKVVDEDVDLEPVLQAHKLRPHISIAALSDRTKTKGRFFTFLPLPIFSSFGIHINAIFALTTSRQHLVNSLDFGIAKNSGDYILREWNKTLFNDFIPRAWKEYLDFLVQQKNISAQSLFESWPTLASHDWKDVPLRVFENVVASKSEIWPLVEKPDSETVFKSLHDILIAKPTEKKVADALTSMGLEITSPPAYIFDFVSRLKPPHSADVRVLSPEMAHKGLLRNVQQFRTASADTIRGILDYLLSTSECLNLVGLPIIPTSAASATRLSLQPAATSTEAHTILDSAQARIFGACDDSSISVSSLPPRAGSVLFDKGPGVLNLKRLTNERIIQYLQYHLANMGSNLTETIPNRANLMWVSAFWEWFGTWEERSALRQMIEAAGLTLIPCAQGLKPLATPVFKAKGMQPLPVRQLTTIGISFVHPDLSTRAHDQLASMDLLKQMSNIHELLDALPSADIMIQPPPETCSGILRHLSAYTIASCNIHGSFSTAQLEKLKSLPVYPVLSEQTGGVGTIVRSFTSIPIGATIRPVRRPPFLPTIHDVVFVELDLLGPLLGFVSTSSDRLDDNGILSLTCAHFLDQTNQFQAFVLEYITKKQGSIPPHIREQLADIAFVTSESGSLIKPGDAIDPKSPIACLFANDPSIKPQLHNESQHSIIDSLRKLKFLQSVLTPALIADRATHISRHHSSEHALAMAHDLLRVICSIPYIDLTTMPPEIITLWWLPTTDKGLQSPDTTRDDRTDVPRHLFDHVLAVLHPAFDLPPYLRHYFGWDQPLPFATLVEQIGFVLNSSDSEHNGTDILETVSDILEDLSNCPESFDTNILEDKLDERRWVPTTVGTLVSIHEAVFEPPANSGFAQINVRPATKDLLLHLGCMDKPTTDAILWKLNILKDLPPSLEIVQTSVILLGCLPKKLVKDEREAIFIPDTTMTLQPLLKIQFNDIGDNALLIPDRGPITHALITDAIAQNLHLENLGLRYADLETAMETATTGMGVTPLGQVQNVLKAYTEGQFLTEFVANAVDAGATAFKLFLSEGVPVANGLLNGRQQVLSPSSMQGLTEAPALIVYNDSVFTEQDFQGICETSVGGKGSLTGTIGQFGLGAATMFYFTEMALVVSGRFVLFLNPSGEYLPHSRTALRLPLKHVKRCYPDHLQPAYGKFGFDPEIEDEEYPGTLFILPLRTISQVNSHQNVAEKTTWDYETFAKDVIKPFAVSAPNCLLFTKLSNISATGYWDFKAVHGVVSGPEAGTGYLVHDVEISAENDYNPSSWRVVSTTVPRNEIPQHVARVSSYIRDPVAGLAARLSGENPAKSKHHSFFSTLPLRIPTSVPVHVTASFILSSDRRNIRLDEYDNSETMYNRWLLGDLLPPLYLFLLENLAFDENIPSNKLKHWWPGYREAADNISRHLIKSFYEQHLGSSLRRVFVGELGDTNDRQPSTPSEVVLTGDEPPTVRKVLVRLQSRRLARLSDGARKRALADAKLSPVTPTFLKDEIVDKLHLFRSLFSFVREEEGREAEEEDPPLNLQDLEFIISYLDDRSQQDAESLLDGLAILPLSNGEFGTFAAPSPSSQSYYSMPKLPNTVLPVPHRFSSSQFIHPGLTHKAVIKLGLNVIKPTAENIVGLIGNQVPATPLLEDAPDELVDWILGNVGGASEHQTHGFWDLFGGYQHLGLTHGHIRDFPLVPTILPHVFVSLANCQEGTALVLDLHAIEDPNGLLRHAFDKLELAIVERDSPTIPPMLRAILDSSEYITMSSLEKVMKAFANKSLDHIGAEFVEIDNEDALHRFAEWIYDSIDRSFAFNGLHESSPLLSVARLLPIWPSASQEEPEIKMCPASQVYLLPEEMQLSQAVPYIKARISDHPSLHHLKGPRFQYTDIPTILDLPDRLEDAQLGQYRNFLVTWLYKLPPTDRPVSIPVPNTSGHICDSSTLYSRTALFIAAYGEDADRFVSPLFSDLENKLSNYGLITEDQLNMDVFRDCVTQIDLAEDNHERVSRASRIFRVYCDRMSVLALQGGAPNALNEFDEYMFIPRRMSRHRRLPGMGDESGLEIHVPSLGGIPARVLRPIDLVREEFEAVAWSQRGCFAEQPDRRILSVYPDLGKPTLTEVVLHLEYLASLTPQDRDDRSIIVHDAKASYTFLMKNLPTGDDQNINEQGSLPHDIHERAIFLNINEADDEVWQWLKGTQLVFNASDGGELFSVKSFLKDFQTLLSQVGAVSVHRPSVERTVIAAPEGQLRTFKEGFDRFRREEKFVDVVFEAQADGERAGPKLRFWAHRSFLSVSSTHFAEMFDSTMTESRNDASAASPIVLPSVKGSITTLYDPSVEHILDYIYSSTPWLPRPDLSLRALLAMLGMANEWSLDELAKLLQEEIVNRNMIEPDTVDEIEDFAENIEPKILLEKCREFKELNQDYITRMLSQIPA